MSEGCKMMGEAEKFNSDGRLIYCRLAAYKLADLAVRMASIVG